MKMSSFSRKLIHLWICSQPNSIFYTVYDSYLYPIFDSTLSIRDWCFRTFKTSNLWNQLKYFYLSLSEISNNFINPSFIDFILKTKFCAFWIGVYFTMTYDCFGCSSGSGLITLSLFFSFPREEFFMTFLAMVKKLRYLVLNLTFINILIFKRTLVMFVGFFF